MVCVLLLNLGSYRTLNAHEGFAAVPAREMLATGDWLVPRFGGLPRLQKPPLAYWVIAGSGALFGEFSEWTVRLPSVLAALTLALLIGWWAGRWYGFDAGVGAALTQATSLAVLIYGRSAEVDMLLCLLIVTALFLIAHQASDESRRRSRWRWIGVWTLLGLSWLAKFHYGAVMVLAPCAVYLVLRRDFGRMWQMAQPVGVLIFLGCAVVWPCLLLQYAPGAWDVWHHELVDRVTGGMPGHEPFWFYLPQLLFLGLPWMPLAVEAVPESWRLAWRQQDTREQFLWVWLLTQTAIVSVPAVKHPNYILPALPALSLLAGRRWRAIAEQVRRGEPIIPVRRAVWLTPLILAGCTAGGGALVRKWPQLTGPAEVFLAMQGLGLCAVFWLMALRRPRSAGVMFLSLYLVCHWWSTASLIPGCDHRTAAAQFGREARDRLPGREIIAYRMDRAQNHMDPVVFYLDAPVSRVESAETLSQQLDRRGELIAVAYETKTDELAALGHVTPLAAMTVPDGARPPKHPPYRLVRLTEQTAGQRRPESGGGDAPPDHHRLAGNGSPGELRQH